IPVPTTPFRIAADCEVFDLPHGSSANVRESVWRDDARPGASQTPTPLPDLSAQAWRDRRNVRGVRELTWREAVRELPSDHFRRLTRMQADIKSKATEKMTGAQPSRLPLSAWNLRMQARTLALQSIATQRRQ